MQSLVKEMFWESRDDQSLTLLGSADTLDENTALCDVSEAHSVPDTPVMSNARYLPSLMQV